MCSSSYLSVLSFNLIFRAMAGSPIVKLVLTAFLASILPRIEAVDATVNLNYSTYIGTAQTGGTGVTEWLGIRFAAPPLGNLRFRRPQDPLVVSAPQPANQVCTCVDYVDITGHGTN